MNALSMAILVLLNAKLALEDSGVPHFDKQMILSEAASIGSMFLEIEEEDVKHDIL